MRKIGVVFFASAALALAQAHGPYGSLGGWGNVNYPGTGHPPGVSPNPNATFPGRLNATVQGRIYGGVPAIAPRASHPAHGRSVIVPYPVYIGGYGYVDSYGYGPNAYPAPTPDPNAVMGPNGAPSVIINQNFAPPMANPVMREYSAGPGDQPDNSGMQSYQTPPSHPYADQSAAAQSEQATIYLLAFKDHTIVPALGYWLDGNTLHYVSVEHSLNQASIDLIDRDLSQRLNDERGVEFRLPAAH